MKINYIYKCNNFNIIFRNNRHGEESTTNLDSSIRDHILRCSCVFATISNIPHKQETVSFSALGRDQHYLGEHDRSTAGALYGRNGAET